MAVSTTNILNVLADHDIHPYEDENGHRDLPAIGQIKKGETVYSTSISEVLGRGDDQESGREILGKDDPRLRKWWGEIKEIIKGRKTGQLSILDELEVKPRPQEMPPEPHCAWYCPIHFFGHDWGIYIRESCILSQARDIATFVDWPSVRAPRWEINRHLLRSAFYVHFLHEQFHHKVESLGFRLLVSTGTDRYRPYKRNVYRRTYSTMDCLEESLANAESYRRLGERRYVQRVHPAIREGLRQFLRESFKIQPPGYRDALKYLSEASHRDGIYNLQSQILDGRILPTTARDHWSIAPNMITSLADITEDIYVVLPSGARPIFRPTSIDPGATVSSQRLAGALTRHYGYAPVHGGKGSHVKLKKAGSPTIIIPGNRPVVSPGVVKNVLDAVGGYPISRLPDLLEGTL